MFDEKMLYLDHTVLCVMYVSDTVSQAELIAVIVDKEMVCVRDGTLCLHVCLCCRSN